MTLIEEVRLSLRLKTDKFDEGELLPIISAAKKMLTLAGVEVISEEDALVRRAVVLYAKSEFGYDDNAEKFMEAFNALKDSMALSGDYKAVNDEI